jgi:hypothetical protein
LPLIQVVRDPNDDFILATAIKAGADYLVARDNDLLVLGTHENIRIVSPETFAQVLNDAAAPQVESAHYTNSFDKRATCPIGRVLTRL